MLKREAKSEAILTQKEAERRVFPLTVEVLAFLGEGGI